jgi:hypothetical protein
MLCKVLEEYINTNVFAASCTGKSKACREAGSKMDGKLPARLAALLVA